MARSLVSYGPRPALGGPRQSGEGLTAPAREVGAGEGALGRLPAAGGSRAVGIGGSPAGREGLACVLADGEAAGLRD